MDRAYRSVDRHALLVVIQLSANRYRGPRAQGCGVIRFPDRRPQLSRRRESPNRRDLAADPGFFGRSGRLGARLTGELWRGSLGNCDTPLRVEPGLGLGALAQGGQSAWRSLACGIIFYRRGEWR